MPVRVSAVGEGVVVEVPACEDDGIARFDVFEGEAHTSGRWAGDEDAGRVIRLVVSPETLEDGSYNSAEVETIGRSGVMVDPFATLIYVSTERGFAEFEPGEFARSELLDGIVVKGDDPQPLPDMSAESLLDDWCR